jgi:DNA invertase Pin-like site-specific DNA recombinase
MKKGYIRTDKAGPSVEQQRTALRAAGISDFSAAGPVMVDLEGVVKTRSKYVDPLPNRTRRISTLNKGDTLVVASADRLGRTFDDILDALAAIGQRGASVMDAETGLTVNLSAETGEAKEFAQRGEKQIRTHVAEAMRRGLVEAGTKRGPQPKLTGDQLALARALYNDKENKMTIAQIAEQIGVSASTLQRALGPRGTPMFGRKPGDKE